MQFLGFAVALLPAFALAAPNVLSGDSPDHPAAMVKPRQSDPLGILTGTHTGDGTWYETGLGACGITNIDADFIAAVSQELFDNYPGYTGTNPNNNPVCGRRVIATYEGKSVTVAIEDRCTGCNIWDLDFSPAAFSQLAPQSVGRIHGVTWQWA